MQREILYLQCTNVVSLLRRDVHWDVTPDLHTIEQPEKSSGCFSHHPICLLYSANL